MQDSSFFSPLAGDWEDAKLRKFSGAATYYSNSLKTFYLPPPKKTNAHLKILC